MQEMSLRPRCMYARLTSAVCFFATAAAAESIADFRGHAPRAWPGGQEARLEKEHQLAKGPRSSSCRCP